MQSSRSYNGLFLLISSTFLSCTILPPPSLRQPSFPFQPPPASTQQIWLRGTPVSSLASQPRHAPTPCAPQPQHPRRVFGSPNASNIDSCRPSSSAPHTVSPVRLLYNHQPQHPSRHPLRPRLESRTKPLLQAKANGPRSRTRPTTSCPSPVYPATTARTTTFQSRATTAALCSSRAPTAATVMSSATTWVFSVIGISRWRT